MTAITDLDIARWRLHNQHLTRPHAGGGADVVGHLLAVQAENPTQSAWAVACRTAVPDRTDLAGLLDSGAVLRTHVLRPTWHYVSAEDLVWLIEVTGPRVRKVVDRQLADAEGMDAASVHRATGAVVGILGERGDLTRPQLAAALRDRGIVTTGTSLMMLLAHLELEPLICSGGPLDGEHTYALLAERVARPRRLGRAEGLAERLASRLRRAVTQAGTCSRSWTSATAATRTHAGCSTPPASSCAAASQRSAWRSSTARSWRG